VGADAVACDPASGVGDVDEVNSASIGITLVVPTVVGLAGGYWAARWLDTEPWLAMIGLGLGIAAGFVNLFRSAR
jgi:ATP synthase protein I